MVAKISLEEALLGTMVTVRTIDHRTVRIPITDVVFPGYEKVVENEGMPILDKYPQKGNLIIRLAVEFPNYLPKSSKELIARGFTMAKIGGGVSQHEVINKLVLADKILRSRS
ncbi:hypothetical protein NQ318_011047 [Aromia moschata]|uniref:Chaperone DnaJ C-terminal domain-containing protein n=1 Tax=Aromia moschata TaxID=1265417 RepID=A0AAV8YTN8_9CUCU|nr:hypothetical protein NQ318_011047 [Aromia moschata]